MAPPPLPESVLPLDPAHWSAAEPPAETAIDPLDVIRMLRSAGGGLLTQAGLYSQLVRAEWALEKRRLLALVFAAAVGFICLLCLLLALMLLVLALSWDSGYRVQAMLAVIGLFSVSLATVWYRVHRLLAQGEQSFGALREELAIDMAMLKQHLTQAKS